MKYIIQYIYLGGSPPWATPIKFFCQDCQSLVITAGQYEIQNPKFKLRGCFLNRTPTPLLSQDGQTMVTPLSICKLHIQIHHTTIMSS